MRVPEAPVNEYDQLVLRQNNIRFPGHILPMQSESIPKRVQNRPDLFLRLRVLPAYGSHIAATLFSRVDVGHN
jgi:hypothetical protein